MSKSDFFLYSQEWLSRTRPLGNIERAALVDLMCVANDKGWRVSWPLSAYWQLFGAASLTLDDTSEILAKLAACEICKLDTHDDIIRVDLRRFARAVTDARPITNWKVPDGWKALRSVVLERDGYACGYCGDPANSVDHVIPKSKGGTEDPLNLTAACKPCNSKKNGRTPEQAGLALREKP